MGFLKNLGARLRAMMQMRYGADQLSLGLFYAALALAILGWIPALGGYLSPLSLLAMGYALFRMLSKNRVARARENDWFVRKITPPLTACKQTLVRFKNRKVYRYPTCPNCRARLRVPRSVGTVTVTCGRCGNKFESKGKK